MFQYDANSQCVLVCVALLCISHTYTTASEPTPLYVLSILPLPVSEQTEGSDLKVVGDLAEIYINNSTEVLPGYSLKLIHDGDSGCGGEIDDGTTAVATLLREVFYDKGKDSRNIVGIVGPICPRPSLALSYQIAQPEISLLAVTMSDSLSLLNRQLYANTFSTLPSSDLIVDTLITLMRSNGWNNILLIYDASEEYYKDIFRGLQDKISNDSMLNSFPIPLFDQFSLLQFSSVPEDVRVIVILANPLNVQRVLCSASTEDSVLIAFPNYQFVVFSEPTETLINSVPSPFVYDGDCIECKVEDLRSVWNQTIILRYHLQPQNASSFVSDIGLSYDNFIRYLSVTFNLSTEDLRLKGDSVFYAAAYFDSILAVAYALNNSMSRFDLSRYKYGQSNHTELLRQQLEKLDFVGVSGRINFNDSTGFVDRNVDILQVENATLKLVQYYDSRTGQIEQYGNESANYVPGRFSQFLYASEAGGIVFLVLFLLVAVVLVFFQVLNVTYAKYPSIKASNPTLSHFAYCSCYIMIIAIVLFIVGESLGDSGIDKCKYHHAYSCLLVVGWSTLFAMLCARAFQMHRIFVHYLNPGRFVEDLYLILFIAGVFFLTVLLVSGWSIYAEVEELLTPNVTILLNSQREPVLWINCNLTAHPGYMTWSNVVYLYSWSFALAACIFATLSVGKIRLKVFQISFILVLCYSLLMLNITILTVVFLIETDITNNPGSLKIDSLLFLYCVLELVSLLICLGLLFIPPVLPLLNEKFQEHVAPKLSSCCGSLRIKCLSVLQVADRNSHNNSEQANCK